MWLWWFMLLAVSGTLFLVSFVAILFAKPGQKPFVCVIILGFSLVFACGSFLKLLYP